MANKLPIHHIFNELCDGGAYHSIVLFPNLAGDFSDFLK